jgi:hypothetical protein
LCIFLEERKVAKLEGIDIEKLNGVKWSHLQKMDWEVLKKLGSRSLCGSSETESVSISSAQGGSEAVNIQSPAMEEVLKEKERKKVERDKKKRQKAEAVALTALAEAAWKKAEAPIGTSAALAKAAKVGRKKARGSLRSRKWKGWRIEQKKKNSILRYHNFNIYVVLHIFTFMSLHFIWILL